MYMKSIKKSFINLIFIILIYFAINSIPVQAKNVVVVIDPGHGGEAEGGVYEDRIERDIDMITATAMKERLEKYDGIEVYLTRTNNTDKEMSRKQRFEYAKSVNADFLFSIHYNMSEYHTLFGSEVWISSTGQNHILGKQFAAIEMESLTSLGLFDRGIKCRLSKDGGEYYGILKYGNSYNIPSVIIEHCHLDEDRDNDFCNYESYINFGELDADSVAKFYGLKSEILGLDFSDYERIEVDENINDPDITPPEYCKIELASSNDTEAYINIYSEDKDNYIQYYLYSTDNGNSWSRLEPWENRTDQLQKIIIPLSEDNVLNLLVKTLNKYDLDATSNVLTLPKATVLEPIDSAENISEIEEIYINPEILAQKNDSNNKLLIILIIIFIIIMILFSFIAALWINQKYKKRKKKTKKHENR